MNYYNDHEPFVAQWLRNLIKGGLLPPGDVDERPIQEVMKNDVRGYTQCHFFAGIGGWSLALQIAGWRTDRPVWTGSCPCQPFSVAGKGRGEKDERHLWPEFRRLIKECSPSVVFGEQTASGAGRIWLDGVRTDLEALGYEVGGADLCAAGISAPHIRQRLYWVGDSFSAGLEGHPGNVDDRNESGRVATCKARPVAQAGSDCWSDYVVIPCGDGKARRIKPGIVPMVNGLPGRVGQIRGYGNSIVPALAAEFIMAYMEVRG